MIEPHFFLLNQPSGNTLLYKIIPSKYFFDMIENNYLYFRRVDTYSDDKDDSEQPDNHKATFGEISFEQDSDFKLSDYYKRCRSRIYACCFSTENTGHLWKNYSGGDINAVCLVFEFDLLRKQINLMFEQSRIIYQDKSFPNFFSINYGLVQYGKFNNFISKRETAANPIEFAYFKKEKYYKEKEARITLATHGIYEEFHLDNSDFVFPESIKMSFDLKNAINSSALKQMCISPKSTEDFRKELTAKLKDNKINVKFSMC